MLQVVVLALFVGLAGCAGPSQGVDFEQQAKASQYFRVTESAVLLSARRHTEAVLRASELYHYSPGQVLPEGTVVTVVPPSDPRVSGASANLKLPPPANPWFLVHVVDGLGSQQNREGWVHIEQLASAPDKHGFSAPKSPLKVATKVCADRELTKCELEVHPSLPARFVTCEGGVPTLEFWDPDGRYVAGYVDSQAFSFSPCPGGQP